MTAIELLAELHQRRVTLQVNGDRLCWRALRGAVSAEILQEMKRQRTRLIRLVSHGSVLDLIRDLDLEPMRVSGGKEPTRHVRCAIPTIGRVAFPPQ